MLQHATCLAIDGAGVLLLGPSGAGKSDLALRLGMTPWALGGRPIEVRLVADDQVEITAEAGRLTARAPAAIAGKLEVRGLGVIDAPAAQAGPVVLCLAVRLVLAAEVERMPEPGRRWEVLGVRLPLVQIAPFEASAPAKVILAAVQQSGG
jgi:serine kinase of HPr protein (carbohydrate metabolism regulator)